MDAQLRIKISLLSEMALPNALQVTLAGCDSAFYSASCSITGSGN